MSAQVTLEVCTLTGLGKMYEVNLDLPVIDLIKLVVETHPSYSNSQSFDIKNVDWSGTRLMLNGKTLDHFRVLETYAEFHVNSKGKSYKLHIIVKGGSISNQLNEDNSDSDVDITPSSLGHKEPSSPISIKPHFNSGQRDKILSQSFPGTSSSPTTSFLENQINRIDRRSKSDQVKFVNDSLNDLSNYIKSTPEISDHGQKLHNILTILLSIDQKLAQLIL